MFYTSCVLVCLFVLVKSEQYITEISGEIQIEASDETVTSEINPKIYKVVKSYHCSVSNLDVDPELLLYGTNAWKFPLQDVNLTLTYPTISEGTSVHELLADYKVTKISVKLLLDSTDSTGYILSGGLLQNNIIMSFICGKISYLEYQFWLYGVKDDKLDDKKYEIWC